jgi:hypothetical protein
MANFNNNLRIKEITTGTEAGSWGDSTNLNLRLIGEALGYATDATFDTDANKTVIVNDATSDPYRSMYVKVTSSVSLSTARDLTITPNTIKRVMFIENATTGGQSIVVKEGSGASVTIPNGSVSCVYLDGAGSGAGVVSVFTDFVMQDSVKISGTTPTLTLGDGDAEDTKIVFDGNAVDYYMGLDDSADQLIIGRESTVGSLKGIVVNTNCASNTLTIGGSYSLESRSADGGVIGHFLAETAEALIRTDTLGDNPVDFGSDTSGNFVVKTGSTPTKRFSILDNSTGDVLVETGGLFVQTNDGGLYLNSANGTEYKITVSNAGALVVTAT